MKRGIARIHQNKRPVRRHYIAEWLEARDMGPMDLLRALNEPDSSEPAVEKSQVYRWVEGQLPRAAMQIRIAAAVGALDPETGAPDPEALLRHPDDDWIARKLQGRDREEINRIKQMIDLAFPDKTGTEG